MILPGAEPFLFAGGRRGVLLIHGITGSPSEMKLLGQYISEKGFTVLGVRLCGHGTDVAELERTQWPQWYSSAEDGYHLLSSICDEVNVVGLSMGGLLTLKLAGEYQVGKIVVLNTPIYIAEKKLPLLPLLRVFRTYIPKKRRKLPVDPIYNISYERWPLSSIGSLLELIQHTDGLLTGITAPALVVQSKHDRTVRPESARHIYDLLASRVKRLIWHEHSGHVITLDEGHQEVFKDIAEFLLNCE